MLPFIPPCDLEARMRSEIVVDSIERVLYCRARRFAGMFQDSPGRLLFRIFDFPEPFSAGKRKREMGDSSAGYNPRKKAGFYNHQATPLINRASDDLKIEISYDRVYHI